MCGWLAGRAGFCCKEGLKGRSNRVGTASSVHLSARSRGGSAEPWGLLWTATAPPTDPSPTPYRRSAVVNHLSSRHPELKPLLLLNVGRTKSPQVGRHARLAPGRGAPPSCALLAAGLAAQPSGPKHPRHPAPSCARNHPQARTPAAQALMSELRESKSFYITPAGSNDDWCGGSGALHALRQRLPRWRCPRARWEKPPALLPLSPPVLPRPAAVPAGTGFTRR